MSKKGDNYLLSKNDLGKVKAGFHKLPPEGHTYGKAPVKDQYGAREVISNWVTHDQSQVKQAGKDYVAMNRQGIKSGCIDSKQISQYRKGHEIKQKVKEGQKYYGVDIPSQQFTYGIPNRPSTPIKNVVCNTYAIEEEQLKRERDAVKKMLENEKKPKPAKVESPKKIVKEDRKKIVEENNFKLSKFKNVESKIKPMISEQKNKA